jgi:hypothetical protein
MGAGESGTVYASARTGCIRHVGNGLSRIHRPATASEMPSRFVLLGTRWPRPTDISDASGLKRRVARPGPTE